MENGPFKAQSSAALTWTKKLRKKKLAFPRRTWQINPVARGKSDLPRQADEQTRRRQEAKSQRFLTCFLRAYAPMR
jgi:hypothetical protein